MALPEQTSIFSEGDIEFANRLIRREERAAAGISCDLERPTWAENNDIGEIDFSWCEPNPVKRTFARWRKRYR